MDSFLDSCFWPIFLPIFDFFYWLICIKLTSIEKNKLRRFGVGSREELWRALIQQHVDNEREMQYEREMDALEYLQSHPEVSRVSLVTCPE